MVASKRCPVCKENRLHEVSLENGLPALQCAGCEGIWISSNPYQLWWRAHRPELPAKEPEGPPEPVHDVPLVKLCADCGHIMTRYRVVPGLQLFVDHCASCNGVWLDRDEWAALVARNLHDKINSFFTEAWQTRLQEEETRATLDRMYLEKLGTDDYVRLQKIRQWLDEHPLRSMLLAYLEAEDPYRLK
jgi:Zn-finger nucleic acid-binding protein